VRDAGCGDRGNDRGHCEAVDQRSRQRRIVQIAWTMGIMAWARASARSEAIGDFRPQRQLGRKGKDSAIMRRMYVSVHGGRGTPWRVPS